MPGDTWVIDGDGHVMEPEDLWLRRMDHARWGDWIPREEVVDDCYQISWAGGEVRSGGKELQDRMAAAVGMTAREFHEMTEIMRVPGGFDPDLRVKDMDRDGIDAAVLFPSKALFFGPVDPIPAFRDVEFVLACQQAYNDWLAEHCATHPRRLFGLAIVPLQSPDLAVAEAQRAIRELGLNGVCIRPSAYVDELPLNHPAYDPFWAACQDLDAAVALHPGVHVDTPGACRKFGLVADSPNVMVTNMAVDQLHGGSGLGQAVGNAVDMIVSLGRLLMGGVCERFPRLRFLALEAGGGWIPTLLERMDEQVKAFPLERRWLSLLPSEYFQRQCYAGFECEEWNLAACAEKLGVDRILWASDYPHPEYHPGLLEDLRGAIAPFPQATRRRILGQNAIEAYRLPLDPAGPGAGA
jgi:predicted TIM-barrel fold metal-dependent hydrolase